MPKGGALKFTSKAAMQAQYIKFKDNGSEDEEDEGGRHSGGGACCCPRAPELAEGQLKACVCGAAVTRRYGQPLDNVAARKELLRPWGGLKTSSIYIPLLLC